MGKHLSNRVVVFPAFSMGHFIPMLEFAKRLSAVHHFSVTFIVADWHVPPNVVSKYERLLSSNEAIDIQFVRLPPTEDPSHLTDVRQRVVVLEESTKPLLEDALRREVESGPVAAFITDFFCAPFFDVPLKLHLPIYVFFVSTASFLCLMLYAPTLAQTVGLPIRDPQRMVEIPGMRPIQAKQLPDLFLGDAAWEWFSHYCYPLPKARGFLINTCVEMEQRALKTLQEGRVIDTEGETKEYRAVGPLIQSSLFEQEEKEKKGGEEECLRWLDLQPPKSVLYISFGSRAPLSAEQIAELACGLETSEQRFLWVLQKPHTSAALQQEPPKDKESFLPDGFLSRTQERGLVCTKWAPQVAILSHPSTGGFLTHCGWNSTLETVLCGVTVLTFPQAAEQRMNEVLLVEEMKVGVSLRREENGIANREEVEKAVKQLMSNEEVREKMKRVSEAANLAVAEGGESFESFAAVACTWKSECQSWD